MLNTFLCDELDKNALRLAFAKWRGEAVDPPQLKIALSNLVSYGIHLTPDSLFLSKGEPTPSLAAVPEEEIEKGFQSLLTVQAPGDASVQKIGDGTFLKLVLPVVLKLLAGFLV